MFCKARAMEMARMPRDASNQTRTWSNFQGKMAPSPVMKKLKNMP